MLADGGAAASSPLRPRAGRPPPTPPPGEAFAPLLPPPPGLARTVGEDRPIVATILVNDDGKFTAPNRATRERGRE